MPSANDSKYSNVVNLNVNQTGASFYKWGDFCDPDKFKKDKINDSSLDYFECSFYKIGYDPNFFSEIFKNSSVFKDYLKSAFEFIHKNKCHKCWERKMLK